MKSIRILTSISTIVLFAFFFVSNAQAAVVGGSHDMATYTVGGTSPPVGAGGECRWCHAPHNADQALAPLWDRYNSVIAGFTVYTSDTIDVAIGQPTGVSLACLSCHDGATALDSYNQVTGDGATMSTAPELAATTAILGTDLSNDHPVSMNLIVGSEFDVAANITTAGLRLFNGGSNTVECASCHDPHKIDTTFGLRIADNTLCTTCHVK